MCVLGGFGNNTHFFNDIWTASFDPNAVDDEMKAGQENGGLADENDAYTSAIIYLYENGIVDGYPDGNFKPDNLVNVVEALKIILEAFNYDISDTNDEWYQFYVNFAKNNDLFLDTFNNYNKTLTRGEMAELIYRILNTN